VGSFDPPPVATVAPGESVHFECVDASGGQLAQDSTAADLAILSFERVNPVTGPVYVEGALFSIGDTHAAQGDGEVCGTAIESPMNVSLTLYLIRDQPLKFPRFTTPGPVTRHLDARGYEVTTGIGPDLMTGARDALAAMVDLICAQHKLSPVQAYMLCSVCGDLRISEIVDMPNWVVSFYLPRIVFE